MPEVAPMVAVVDALLVHQPPEEELLNETDEPIQRPPVPEIADGKGYTVTTFVVYPPGPRE